MNVHLHVNDEPYSDFEITDDVTAIDYLLLFQCLHRLVSDMLQLSSIESIAIKRYHNTPSNNCLKADGGDSAAKMGESWLEGDLINQVVPRPPLAA